MDDLKLYWNKALEHKFWILSAIVLLASGIVYYLTSSSLSEQITTRRNKVDAAFTQINTIGGKAPNHPNKFSHDKMNESIAALEEDVQKGWQVQYDRQKGLLVWPNNAFAFPETKNIFEQLRPFEKFVNFPIKDDDPAIKKITFNDRDVYKNYIGPEFEKLAEIIGSEWKAKLSASSAANSPYGGANMGTSGPPGMTSSTAAPESTDLVRWSLASQQKLQEDVVPWYGKGGPPTVLDIYYTQEDLWLLTGIMNIIASANAGAQENFQALVKEIEWIRLGKNANLQAGSLYAAAAATASSSGMGGPPAGYGGGGGGPPAGYSPGGGSRADQMTGGASAAKVVSLDPADGRYVDSTFKTMTGKELRTALEIKDPNQAVKGVAKRIPIRMRLVMDPTKIDRLVAECGNANLTLEIYQIRLNCDAAAEGAAAGGSSAGGPAGGKDKPSFGGVGGGAGMMGEGPTGPPTDSGGGVAATGSELTEVPVEIFGLIYLYNMPPELGGKKPAGAVPASAAANATRPAVPPAAPSDNEGQ